MPLETVPGPLIQSDFHVVQKSYSIPFALPMGNATFQVCFWMQDKMSISLSFILFLFFLFHRYHWMSNIHSGYHSTAGIPQIHLESQGLSTFSLDKTHMVLILTDSNM